MFRLYQQIQIFHKSSILFKFIEKTPKRALTYKAFLIVFPEQEIIINILSDQSYMRGLYNQLMFIKELQEKN